MLYPSIDKILTQIDSKYALIHIVSKRSKDLSSGKNGLLKNYDSAKNIGKALEEISSGKIVVK